MNKKHGAWSKNEKIFLGLLAPILVLFFCFNTLPLIKGFYYGLTNFRGYGSYDFVGLRNFAEIFQDSRVGHSYLFTFKYALVMTIVVNLLSLILALGLNSKIRGKMHSEESILYQIFWEVWLSVISSASFLPIFCRRSEK